MTEENNNRTVISVSISTEDKKNIKILAAEQEKTVSGLIHEWIEKEMNRKNSK